MKRTFSCLTDELKNNKHYLKIAPGHLLLSKTVLKTSDIVTLEGTVPNQEVHIHAHNADVIYDVETVDYESQAYECFLREVKFK